MGKKANDLRAQNRGSSAFIEGSPFTHKEFTMHKTLKAILRPIAILICLTMLFCGLLFLAGLGGEPIQARVREHVGESIPLFEAEGSYPELLNVKSQFYTLDNFTETIILQEALFMDTARHPINIFENPRVNLIDVPEGTNAKVASLIAAVNGEQANSKYSYYWMGFRSIVRPLLIFMNYPYIRMFLSLGFYLLFAATCFSLYRHANMQAMIAFLFATLGVNCMVASVELQYATCFYVMFFAMLLLPYIKKTRFSYPEFFLIVGACTQFFDFYTTPVITLGGPLLFLLASQNLLADTDTKWKVFLKCSLFWLLGYGATWLIRLMLVYAVTNENIFAEAFQKLRVWTGVTYDSRYSDHSIFGAIWGNVRGIFIYPNLPMYGVTAMATCVLYIMRNKQRKLRRPLTISLFVALLPILWIAVSYHAAIVHNWFQYRSLFVLIFGVLVFAFSPFIQDDRPEKKIALEQEPKQSVA